MRDWKMTTLPLNSLLMTLLKMVLMKTVTILKSVKVMVIPSRSSLITMKRVFFMKKSQLLKQITYLLIFKLNFSIIMVAML